ncbi:MAG: hypothetical protein JW779_06700 [Candidatus Thorarchaeota archaeon]|nr:hypothetical protein [Candidatus Thorarchaeota archaeon]
MIEKKYSELLRIKPKPDKMTFSECSSGLRARFDRGLLEKHLPVTSGVQKGDQSLLEVLGVVIPESTREALKATEFIGVYGRIVTSEDFPNLLCLQYLYVWDYQAVPAHEADYEPIFVYVDKRREYAIYDLAHYCSRRIDLSAPIKGTLGLRMIPGWHSFLPAYITDGSRDNNLNIQPLSDQHLRSWWSIPEEAPRLKIVNHLRDPFQLQAPGHFMDAPDENAKTMCCSFLQIENAMAEFDDPRQGIIEGVKRAFANCVGLLAFYRIGAFIQLLTEMSDIGMLKVPLTSKGIDLVAISNLLRDGLVSLTNAGRQFFEDFYMRQPSEDEPE